MNWELGVNRCSLLPLECISNEILLCSTGNYVQSLMMEHDNVRKRMYTCMCDWVTLLYRRKLTEHCKPAIIEKNKNHYIKKILIFINYTTTQQCKLCLSCSITSLVLICLITGSLYLLTAFFQFLLLLPPKTPYFGNHKSDLFFYEFLCS